MRYMMECRYKGTYLNGWQKQLNAPSVQAAIEKAMAIVWQREVEIVGSSRTDTGVHAEQQYAHFEALEEIPEVDKFINSLNRLLPHEVAICRIFQVPDNFHARFAAKHRCYEYRIVPQKNPFLTDLAAVFWPQVNLKSMNEAATLLLQYDDFQCFSKMKTDVKTFNCQISYAFWEQRGEQIVFCIKANRFLRGMVRAIVGTLLEVGQGRLTIADFERIIVSKDRQNAAAQAPAQGLFLTEVGYDFSKIPLTINL